MNFYSKISSKLLKLLFQPGRLFFSKGSVDSIRTYDSFSLEYLLIVQETSRIELTSIPDKYKKNVFQSVVLFPIFLIRFFFLLIRLIIVNNIITSYLNSAQIKELLLNKYENSNS